MNLKGILIPLQAFHHYEESGDHGMHYSVPIIRLSLVVNQCMRLDCEWLKSMAFLCTSIIGGDGK